MSAFSSSISSISCLSISFSSCSLMLNLITLLK
nr:MAG TPA: hypothetical protein [Caudoviricetes sp.]